MGFGIEELQAVERVMKSGCLSGYRGNWSEDFYGGKEIRALESEWSKYFKVKHSIAINSATSGLWSALNSIDLKNGDECVCTPYTMTCSASLPLLFGAKPVFADIESNYFCIEPEDIERKITTNTKAIIAVDIFGLPCDFDRINEIAERKGKEYGHKIYVIEDAAQAPGAKYKNRYAGTLGDIGVYSLNFHKHIHAGEGGIVVTNDDELAFKLRLSMNHSESVVNDLDRQGFLEHGCKEHQTYLPIIGMNLRMTELSAAIAREQLKKLDSILEKYREDAKYFPVKVRPECEHSYYRYAWTKETTDELINNLDKQWCMKCGYIQPIFQMPLFRHLGYDQEQCPIVQEVNKNICLAWQKEAY